MRASRRCRRGAPTRPGRPEGDRAAPPAAIPRRLRRSLAAPRQGHRGLVSRPVPRHRLLTLLAIGTAGGLFSGLFGVGGGTIIVPLLILWLAYGEREATGTSLLAIVIIGTYGAIAQSLYGNVNPGNAAVVGIPALAGVVAGAAVQQRIPERLVALLFAALLVATAAELIF
ncbi:MAG: sulfite exporter TauE/SafE family protein [Actinobacteria bacterium]|nr:MAG: sulfite exporter TauE/SafE family protein [Actinomycetota bacterium]